MYVKKKENMVVVAIHLVPIGHFDYRFRIHREEDETILRTHSLAPASSHTQEEDFPLEFTPPPSPLVLFLFSSSFGEIITLSNSAAI